MAGARRIANLLCGLCRHLSADVSDQFISLRHTGTPDTIFEHPKDRAAHLELIQQEGCAREQGRQRAKKLGMIKGGLSQPIPSTSTREGSLPSDAPRP